MQMGMNRWLYLPGLEVAPTPSGHWVFAVAQGFWRAGGRAHRSWLGESVFSFLHDCSERFNDVVLILRCELSLPLAWGSADSAVLLFCRWLHRWLFILPESLPALNSASLCLRSPAEVETLCVALLFLFAFEQPFTWCCFPKTDLCTSLSRCSASAAAAGPVFGASALHFVWWSPGPCAKTPGCISLYFSPHGCVYPPSSCVFAGKAGPVRLKVLNWPALLLQGKSADSCLLSFI